LIKRDGVAEGAAAGMRSGGQETDIRGMTAIDIGVRHAAEHTEVIPMRLE
jgi:hypothetical protein